MITQTKLTPNNEFLLLKRHSQIYCLFGLCFICIVISNLAIPAFKSHPWLHNSILLSIMLISFTAVNIFSKTLKLLPKNNHKSYWHVKYQDEYFEYINNKGYKYAANFMLTFLFLVMLFAETAPQFLTTISIAKFCQFAVGLGAISYGLPILFLLRGENE